MTNNKKLVIKEGKEKEFIKELNKALVSKEFLDECKLASKLFKGESTDKEKLEFIKCEIYKVCVNSASVGEYRHPDLQKLSDEAKKRGEDCFYYETKGPRCVKASPKYVYKLKRPLTEEEYFKLFNE